MGRAPSDSRLAHWRQRFCGAGSNVGAAGRVGVLTWRRLDPRGSVRRLPFPPQPHSRMDEPTARRTINPVAIERPIAHSARVAHWASGHQVLTSTR